MSENDHKYITNLRWQRGYDDNATFDDICRGEAISSAIRTPVERENHIRHLQSYWSGGDELRDENGRPFEDDSSLRQKTQLLRLERALSNAHQRLKAAGR